LFNNSDKTDLDLFIEVQDTGIGISEDQQEKNFEAFLQQRGQAKKVYGGTGLGLAITKRLVEMMDGVISLESKPGAGSVFKITFKNTVVCPDYEEVADASESELEKETEPAIVFSPGMILVVDDVYQNCVLVREYFKDTPVEVLEARNGLEAVEAARKYKPDLILMDLRMPMMDGYEATRLIKADDGLKHIPIIAVTASTMEEDLKKITTFGFDSYLRKPVSKTQLLNEVARFINTTAVPLTVPEDQSVQQDVLPAAVLLRIPQLLSVLESQFQPLWQLAVSSSSFDTINRFGSRIKELGEKEGVVMLEEYGKRLNQQAENFDVAGMGKSLDDFPNLLTRLKNAGGNQPQP